MPDRRSRLVVALGGNALLRRGELPSIHAQRNTARLAAQTLAKLTHDHDLVVTHGNGPQIGQLALQQQQEVPQLQHPLDVLGAQSEGLIGYLLEMELRRALPDRDVTTILTLVEIDPQDPEMLRPTKPIGPVYSREEWERISGGTNWQAVRDGSGFRRAVPSPRPVRILQFQSITLLLDAGIIPICAGGGGVPVSMPVDNGPVGVEAVIDKDWTSAHLADAIDANMLIMLTDVDAVYRDWDTPGATRLKSIEQGQTSGLHLPEGTIGPKVEAALWFVSPPEIPGRRSHRRSAAIGELSAAEEIVRGKVGTHFASPRSA